MFEIQIFTHGFDYNAHTKYRHSTVGLPECIETGKLFTVQKFGVLILLVLKIGKPVRRAGGAGWRVRPIWIMNEDASLNF